MAMEAALGASYRRRPRPGGHEARGPERGRRPAVHAPATSGVNGGPGHRLGRRPGHAQLAERAGQPPLRHGRQDARARARRLARRPRTWSWRRSRSAKRFDTPVMIRMTTRTSPLARGRRAGRAPSAAASRSTSSDFAKRNLRAGQRPQAPRRWSRSA
ncbi:MAG: hypothetical protein MZU95_15445 [Desulfomicrobium escambiense]|nr:hypothetical protein [Desulfomicrobium escambiense]